MFQVTWAVVWVETVAVHAGSRYPVKIAVTLPGRDLILASQSLAQ